MRRPWNIVDQPVYSLATYAAEGFNMNICTYVTAVSMQPKMYAVAVYHNTKTLHNLQNTEIAVLQLLGSNQLDLVKPLGKKSGNNFDKAAYLLRKNKITDWQNKSVLSDCAALLLLKKRNSITSGDHELFIFDLVTYSTLSETNILTFTELIRQGIIL